MALNSTSAVILGVLHDGPATGGDIVLAASRRLAAQGGVTRSQVYRELPALAEAGYLKAGRPGARSSHPYSITAAGRRAFARWAVSPDGTADSVRSQVVLRLGFGGLLTSKQRAEIIAEARERHQAALAAHRRDASELKRVGDTYGAAVVEFAVAYERAFIKWLDSVPVA